MIKSSPGPFEAKRVEQRANGDWLWTVYDATGMIVATRLTEGNAALFAAAPDLAAATEATAAKRKQALESIVRYVRDFTPQTAPELKAQLKLIEEIAVEALET